MYDFLKVWNGELCSPFQTMVLTWTVMANFMWHLDWAIGCWNIWPNIILSARIVLDEINTCMGRLSNEASSLRWVGLSQSMENVKKVVRGNSSSKTAWVGILVFSGLQTETEALIFLRITPARFWTRAVTLIPLGISFHRYTLLFWFLCGTLTNILIQQDQEERRWVVPIKYIMQIIKVSLCRSSSFKNSSGNNVSDQAMW